MRPSIPSPILSTVAIAGLVCAVSASPFQFVGGDPNPLPAQPANEGATGHTALDRGAAAPVHAGAQNNKFRIDLPTVPSQQNRVTEGTRERYRPSDSRALLSRSATLPCLALIAAGRVSQAAIISSLRGLYAPRTVITSLDLLCASGFASCQRIGRKGSHIEYSLTARGVDVLALTLRELSVQMVDRNTLDQADSDEIGSV
jgi:hypothetical protein